MQAAEELRQIMAKKVVGSKVDPTMAMLVILYFPADTTPFFSVQIRPIAKSFKKAGCICEENPVIYRVYLQIQQAFLMGVRICREKQYVGHGAATGSAAAAADAAARGADAAANGDVGRQAECGRCHRRWWRPRGSRCRRIRRRGSSSSHPLMQDGVTLPQVP